NPACQGDKLCDYSRAITEQGLVQRDLIITASRLHTDDPKHKEQEQLPDDLYFYLEGPRAKADADDETAFDPTDDRFVSLKANPHLLLETVVGSGTIYPVFPPRPLHDVTFRNRLKPDTTLKIDTEIVDGGYIHNSPIDAAVSWGATHVLLIQASPEERV